jgi:hypothetical protein
VEGLPPRGPRGGGPSVQDEIVAALPYGPEDRRDPHVPSSVGHRERWPEVPDGEAPDWDWDIQTGPNIRRQVTAEEQVSTVYPAPQRGTRRKYRRGHSFCRRGWRGYSSGRCRRGRRRSSTSMGGARIRKRKRMRMRPGGRPERAYGKPHTSRSEASKGSQ